MIRHIGLYHAEVPEQLKGSLTFILYLASDTGFASFMTRESQAVKAIKNSENNQYIEQQYLKLHLKLKVENFQEKLFSRDHMARN